MLKKTYGLVYRKGRWFTKNYGRVLKGGEGLYGLQATMAAWWKNRNGEAPPIKINLKRKRFNEVKEITKYCESEQQGLEPGDLVAFREASPFIKVSWKEPEPGK